jgi:hypothetical protein
MNWKRVIRAIGVLAAAVALSGCRPQFVAFSQATTTCSDTYLARVVEACEAIRKQKTAE